MKVQQHSEENNQFDVRAGHVVGTALDVDRLELDQATIHPQLIADGARDKTHCKWVLYSNFMRYLLFISKVLCTMTF